MTSEPLRVTFLIDGDDRCLRITLPPKALDKSVAQLARGVLKRCGGGEGVILLRGIALDGAARAKDVAWGDEPTAVLRRAPTPALGPRSPAAPQRADKDDTSSPTLQESSKTVLVSPSSVGPSTECAAATRPECAAATRPEPPRPPRPPPPREPPEAALAPATTARYAEAIDAFLREGRPAAAAADEIAKHVRDEPWYASPSGIRRVGADLHTSSERTTPAYVVGE